MLYTCSSSTTQQFQPGGYLGCTPYYTTLHIRHTHHKIHVAVHFYIFTSHLSFWMAEFASSSHHQCCEEEGPDSLPAHPHHQRPLHGIHTYIINQYMNMFCTYISSIRVSTRVYIRACAMCLYMPMGTLIIDISGVKESEVTEGIYSTSGTCTYPCNNLLPCTEPCLSIQE